MNAINTFTTAKRIIVKIGSALITDIERGMIKTSWLESFAADLSALKDTEIIIVSSGAIALGRTALGIDLKTPSKDLKIEKKQAAASIGQMKLIEAFQLAFTKAGRSIAQILLNPADTEHRRTHLNARATLHALLSHNIIPVINENDTTATDEIRFGDNDRLAARVAQMMEADVLLILSTTDGLYTDNPMTNSSAQHIKLIENITDDVINIAGEALSGVSTGGMKSKVSSAKIAVDAGTHVIITSGIDLHAVKHFIDGKIDSTLFRAADTPHNARKRWIKAHLKPTGSITIDDGAVTALNHGKSLLPIGVEDIKGQFERGDAVNIKNMSGEIIAIGLCAYDEKEAAKIKGHHSEDLLSILGYSGRDVLVHRNDLVLMCDKTM